MKLYWRHYKSSSWSFWWKFLVCEISYFRDLKKWHTSWKNFERENVFGINVFVLTYVSKHCNLISIKQFELFRILILYLIWSKTRFWTFWLSVDQNWENAFSKAFVNLKSGIFSINRIPGFKKVLYDFYVFQKHKQRLWAIHESSRLIQKKK